MKYRIWAIIAIIVLLVVSYAVQDGFVQKPTWLQRHFQLGLDLAGGTELVYRAETVNLQPADVSNAMESLRDVIERRVNAFGVAEPIVQIEEASAVGGRTDNRLVVQLPGVTDVAQAIELIGKTPALEFRLERDDAPTNITATTSLDQVFAPTQLTGRYLDRSRVDFDPTTGAPYVTLIFNDEGADLFAKITRENTGKILAIYLDNAPISTPVIREEITGGQAQITGTFTIQEARELVRDLNYGALPVPIELVGTQTVGPSLGQAALSAGIRAGILAFIVIAIFLILYYRLPGVVATISLIMYVALSLAIFKLVPVTLTAAGIAGFILSIGMAVDANILIFERMKEELRKGLSITDAMHEGFHRAWLSIRDSNIASIITAIILFWLGTSAVKGFALTLGIGVAISMFTAITFSRTLLYAIVPKAGGKTAHFLFSNGLKK
jgi:preprotein translocase subunit SecD